MKNYNIIIVEDNVEIANGIKIYLENSNYNVFLARNGEEGLKLINDNKIHLGIVDILMPVMDGVEMVKQVRKNHNFPIIMLSAKTENVDKVHALNIGADDYMTKPFVPMELIARVSSHLRRYDMILSLTSKDDDVYAFEGLELHTRTKKVYLDGDLIKVTPIEYKILELLMETPGTVYSASQIYEFVWDEPAISNDTVMVHIRNLRGKIEVDSRNPRYLKVVWGIGYKIGD